MYSIVKEFNLEREVKERERERSLSCNLSVIAFVCEMELLFDSSICSNYVIDCFSFNSCLLVEKFLISLLRHSGFELEQFVCKKKQ